ncbi:hypothetical protein GGS24DRAFT_472605 [Hypoxylon argillaceum]|nr:hypothetical protein GGS24DRAFT_472605 [Hypoxylon argillaceum]KAI1146334.1 hypothetical protein F4825DRAFT_199537 [Nemania diffusa]
MSLSCANFHGNYTEAEWFQVLELILSHCKGPLYIILDFELVHIDLAPFNSFSWLSAFRDFFQKLSARNTSTCLKVLLVAYGPALPFFLYQDEYSEFVIPASLDSTSRHRHRTQLDDMKRLRRQIKERKRSTQQPTLYA